MATRRRTTAATANNARLRGDKSTIKRPVAAHTTAKVQELIELTMAGYSPTEAAERMDMQPQSVRALKQRADFREGFEAAISERRESFRRKIEASVGAALATLLRTMASEDSRWRDKTEAANSILDRAGLARVTKTEAKVESVETLAELLAEACPVEE